MYLTTCLYHTNNRRSLVSTYPMYLTTCLYHTNNRRSLVSTYPMYLTTCLYHTNNRRSLVSTYPMYLTTCLYHTNNRRSLVSTYPMISVHTRLIFAYDHIQGFMQEESDSLLTHPRVQTKFEATKSQLEPSGFHKPPHRSDYIK